jgi:hypothetical protein
MEMPFRSAYCCAFYAEQISITIEFQYMIDFSNC